MKHSLNNDINVGHIVIQNLEVSFGIDGHQLKAVSDLSFAVSAGEFLCLLGTSGCGKTTILNAVAGFIPPSKGQILLNGKPIQQPGPDRGMVFQHHELFPWMTVRKNVEFGLKMKGLADIERKAVASEYISMVGLKGFEDRYPWELSGGMAQRVGLARMLAIDPLVLLMDEPFGSLDAQTRIMMQELLLKIWDQTQKTIIFVTHDVEEAVLLSNRILVLTARPASVKEEIQVDLERPRKYEIVTSSQFVEIKQHALALIREETRKTIQI